MNNHNLVFEMARGEYFRWAAHDDICEPTLIGECVLRLDADDDLILVHPEIIQIDGEETRLRR